MRTLDLAELRRISVIDAGTGERIGDITDAIVHPLEGRFLGILVRGADGEESVLPVDALRIGENAVMATTNPPLQVRASSTVLHDGRLAAGHLVGTNVVTDDGRLIGKVNDVHVLPELNLVAYKVTGSVLQKMFGGGFFIAGDLPTAVSADGVRMIVPSDTEENHAAGSVEELLRPKEQPRDAGRAGLEDADR